TAGASAAGMLVDERTDRVFVADPRDETMWVLDARSGALLRTVAIGYMPNGLRGVVDPLTDRIFVWASGLRVLDAHSGAILRTIINVGDMLAADEQTGRVFDADDVAKRVSVLDARSGAILRTVALGQAPHQIVVSAATGHVFVLGDKALWMLDARTGRVLRTLWVGPWPAVSTIPSVTATGSELIVRLPTGRINLV